MKLGILSDTHDRIAAIDMALDIFESASVSLVVHCGDWAKPAAAAYFKEAAGLRALPVRGALGNNDKQVEEFLALSSPDFLLGEGIMEFTFADRRVAVHHGHHAPSVKQLIRGNHDLVLFGHSHKPRYDVIDTKILLNPGSTAFAIPRAKDWKASIAIYDYATHEAEFIYFDPQ